MQQHLAVLDDLDVELHFCHLLLLGQRFSDVSTERKESPFPAWAAIRSADVFDIRPGVSAQARRSTIHGQKCGYGAPASQRNSR
ncbi:hypothetical protein ACH5AO_10605 [Streptomyces sp. NPDC018964]|uniref:hypothetical protein n=1 Tax=Streptomyces sp. NPDC018964 TaxID=3365058 RepID=UPI0037875A16